MIIAVISVSACTTDNSKSGTPIPAGATQAPATGATTAATAAATQPATSMAENTYKITTEGNNVIITGNGVVKTTSFKLPADYYVDKFTYDGSTKAGHMDYFESKLVTAAGKTESSHLQQTKGTILYYDAIHYPESSIDATNVDYTFETVAPTTGNWRIEFVAPPAESSIKTAPVTFTGKGPMITDPFTIPTSKCKLQVNYAGPTDTFSVTAMEKDPNHDQYPGFYVTFEEYLSNDASDNNGQVSSPFIKSLDIDMGDPNQHMLLDIKAPVDQQWTVTVTPQ